MAIYSLQHKCIGKSTQDRPFTAAAHVRYIMRDSACREAVSKHAPEISKQAQKWIKAEEEADRKNARVCDKVMIALPKELNAEERVQLVRDFADRVTAGGRVPWLAAIHDKDKDEKNPHCHMVFRDRDLQTGKRVLHMSAGKGERRLLKERGIDAMTTKRMRVIWEHAANDALALAGHKERIDHRSLAEQGIDRAPTIHEGVKVGPMEKRGERPVSKVVQFPNGTTARSYQRSVDYRQIDHGLTRAEYNAKVIGLAKNSVAASRTLGDDSSHVARRQDRIAREDRSRNSESGSRPRGMGRPHSNGNRDAGNSYQDQRAGRPRHFKVIDGNRQHDNRRAEAARYRGQENPKTPRVSPKNHKQGGNVLTSDRRGFTMSDVERLNAMLAQCDTEDEKMDMLKYIHEETQRQQLENGRNHDAGLTPREEAVRVRDDSIKMQKAVESRLKQSEKGRGYLQGEALEVSNRLDAEDRKAREVHKRESEKQQREQKRQERLQKAFERQRERQKARKRDRGLDFDDL